ncbi:hypothetical protein H6G91_37425 [Nostoc muscorum FACHB-395]|nr:hypothetical protein [Desmonostoc muscorum FACHB-395]
MVCRPRKTADSQRHSTADSLLPKAAECLLLRPASTEATYRRGRTS